MNEFLQIGKVYKSIINGELYRYNGLIKDYDYTMKHEFESCLKDSGMCTVHHSRSTNLEEWFSR